MLRNVNSTPPPNPEPNGPIGLETNSSFRDLLGDVVVAINKSRVRTYALASLVSQN
jgi:hypothetical protein